MPELTPAMQRAMKSLAIRPIRFLRCTNNNVRNMDTKDRFATLFALWKRGLVIEDQSDWRMMVYKLKHPTPQSGGEA